MYLDSIITLSLDNSTDFFLSTNCCQICKGNGVNDVYSNCININNYELLRLLNLLHEFMIINCLICSFYEDSPGVHDLYRFTFK